MFKKILIAVVALIVAILAVAWFAPKEASMEKSIVINKPKETVFGYVKLLKEQEKWSPWAKADPAAKTEFKGTDGTVGFIAAWASEKSEVGVGEQEIIGLTEGERVDIELRFKEPFENTGKAYFLTESAGENQTKVTWGFSGSSPWPYNIMCFVMRMTGQMDKQLETGLNNMKAELEK